MRELTLVDAPNRKLTGPTRCRSYGQPRGKRIDAAGVQGPLVFGRLAPMKSRCFQSDRAVSDASGKNVGSNVRGILQVMRDYRNGIFRRRYAVRKRRRT